MKPERKMVMKIRREQTWEAYWLDWCPSCGQVIAEEHKVWRHTGMPGICYYGCKKCGNGYQVNMLESDSDLMEVEDTYTFPTKEMMEEHHRKMMENLDKHKNDPVDTSDEAVVNAFNKLWEDRG